MKEPRFVVCIDNTDYPASLEVRKVYELVKDTQAEKEGYLRVIDESGEHYLYGSERFVKSQPHKDVGAAVIQAA